MFESSCYIPGYIQVLTSPPVHFLTSDTMYRRALRPFMYDQGHEAACVHDLVRVSPYIHVHLRTPMS